MAGTAAKDGAAALLVPGLEAGEALYAYEGQTISVFVKGLEAFSTYAGGEVTLKGRSGETVKATVNGAQPGRLYTLSQQYMGRSIATLLSASRTGNYNFQDVAHFRGLEEAYGKEALGPLEPYTVVEVTISPRPAS